MEQTPASASRRPLRIGIATSGRFWMIDLARELHALGHHVRLYTYFPPTRARALGLPPSIQRFLPEVLPIVGALRYGPRSWRNSLEHSHYQALNRAIIGRLEPCDVLVGMSGLILEAAIHAKARFGAKIFLERGSQHITSQAEILSAIPGAEVPTPTTIERELAGYELADRVVVPSRHAERSFAENGFPTARLLRNPFGVDVSHFTPPRQPTARMQGKIAFVGRWCLRKGCDLLTQVILNDTNLSLLHAGDIGDCHFPNHPRFQSLGRVDQTRLPAVYAQVNLLTLPSREDGFGLVLSQALACGVPIVCSDRTGGEDLAEFASESAAISVAPMGDAKALTERIHTSLTRTAHLVGQDLLGAEGRAALSWSAYGRRYERGILGSVPN